MAQNNSDKSTSDKSTMDQLSHENRVFPPPADFAKKARVGSKEAYLALYNKSLEQPEAFWREQAQQLKWDKPFQTVLDWKPPFAKWFVEGELNASVQCLDKHKGTPRWNKTAMIWVGEGGEVRNLSYAEMTELTAKTANALKSLGVKKGDIVTIYMPMVPEVAAAMLACARLGAAHSVVFGGFSSEALKDRIHDANAKVVITADGGYRRGQVVPLKANVDAAVAVSPSIEKVLVLKRTGSPVEMKAGRDVWWHDVVNNQSSDCPPVSVNSENLLFTLYTSGTTGKPKGLMHTTAGYCLWTMLTTQWVFDLQESDIYWCTADVGWVTGHSYIIYGPFQNGATTLVYEGAPNHPDWGRFWKIIQDHKVSIFYTAPTAIRAFMGQGEAIPAKYDMSSLRLMGSVGEPINPSAWMWYRKNIGGDRCPIVDTWWQTETGGILVSPMPGAIAAKPGSCTLPLPGIVPKILKKDGTECGPHDGGFLTITRPWPGITRGVWGDPERFKKTYWSDFQDIYFTGDGARKDEDGYLWVMGRVDDVINVSGHRLGTAEVESSLVSHPSVVEAAVVGRPDDLKGQAIVAFVTLEAAIAKELKDKHALIQELKAHVTKDIGALARPDEIRLTQALPKTRSGKIMRRLLREIAGQGVAKGDTTTLEDEKVLLALMAQAPDDEE